MLDRQATIEETILESVERVERKIDEVLKEMNISPASASQIKESVGIAAAPTAPQIIQIAPGDDIPWLIEARKWEGKSELFDQEELTAYLRVNPNDKDGGVPWCAYFINRVLEDCGIEGTGSGAAVSFSEGWGTPCDCVDGAIVVWGPGKIKGGHVGIVVGDGVFGGNQGDCAQLNFNRAWFDQNKTLIGYFCPPGYELLTAA